MAAGNPQIATAAIGLIPVITGVRGNIASQLASSSVMRGADQAGRTVGSRMGSTITSALKTGLKVGGVITAAVAGMTLKGGINRALGIEDARAKMSGLGHDTATVEKIMGNALSSVEGTAFGLDAAATTAAGAVAAGIKPGQQLEKTLSTVANTAAAAGTGMDEIGNIFNTVAAVGAAYTGDINMIAQRGIPIWQSLSDTLGVSQEEVKKMASEGAIDFATFETAAADAAGGVATAMGDTTRGSLANMLTSFSKLGADVVNGFLPMVKAGATGIQSVVQAITAKMSPLLTGLFESFTPGATAGIEGFFAGLVTWIEAFDPQPMMDFFGRVGGIGKTVFAEITGGITAFGAAWSYSDGEVTSSGFPGFMERAAYFVHQLWDSLKELDFSSFSGFMDSLGGINLDGAGSAFGGIGAGLTEVAKASPGILSIAIQALGGALQFLSDHADTVVKLMPFIVAGFAAWKLHSAATTDALVVQRSMTAAMSPVMLTNNALILTNNILEGRSARAKTASMVATNSQAVATTRATIAERARTIATKLGTIATTIAAGAQRAFGAALRFAMGPIGWIITGVTLLVGALVLFFTKTEVGQKLWSKIWGWIKDAAAAVVDWFMGTALPYLQAAWDGIAAGALWLYNNAILPAWNGIKTAISAVGDWITGTLWPALQAAWSAIGTAAIWLWQSVMLPVWDGIKLAIAIAVTAVLVYIDLLKWYFSNVIAPVALWLWHSVITPVWAGIQAAIGAVVAWVRDVAWPVIKAAWDAIAAAAVWLWQNALKPAWAGIQAAISAVVTWFRDVAWPLLGSVIDWIAAKFDTFKLGLSVIWGFIKNSIINPVASWFQNTVWPIFNTVIAGIQASFEGWKILLGAVWDFVKNQIINPVITWFRDTAWPLVSGVLDSIKTGFNVMRDSLGTAWVFIKDTVINPVVTWFRDTVKPIFDTVTGNISDAFGVMKDGVKEAWDGIKDAARVPAKFVVEDVYDKTIKETFNGVAENLGIGTRLPPAKLGFASGGVLPGYTPGRDVHQFYSPTGGRLDLSGGEAIMRPEFTRAVGGAAGVAALNVKARRGEAFAGGGVWGKIKGVGGDAWDWMKDKAGTIAEALGDPLGVLTKLAGKAMDLVPGGGMARELVQKAGINAATQGGEWLKNSLLNSEVSSDAVSGAAPSAGIAGGGLGTAQRIAKNFGLTMTSHRRGGARTAGSGAMSLHALGRAMDFSNSGGPTPEMMNFFNAMFPYRPTELLYSPAGGRNLHRGGGMYANTGKTRANHFNHVHVGFKDGGIFDDKPYLYDQGGEIPPGVRVIANRTNRPEKVLPPRESKVITELGKRGGDGMRDATGPTVDDMAEAMGIALSALLAPASERDLVALLRRTGRAGAR